MMEKVKKIKIKISEYLYNSALNKERIEEHWNGSFHENIHLNEFDNA